MAQKRAMIAATLIAVNASEFYTQDLEDLNISAIDTGGHPAGTKAAAQAVAERKIEDLKKPTERRVEEIPLEVLETWAKMKGVKSCIEELGKMKQQFLGAMGPAGETEYYRVLAGYDVKHSNEMPSAEKARECLYRMWKVEQAARALRGPQSAEELLDAMDAPEARQ